MLKVFVSIIASTSILRPYLGLGQYKKFLGLRSTRYGYVQVQHAQWSWQLNILSKCLGGSMSSGTKHTEHTKHRGISLVYRSRTQLPYESCSTHLESLLIVTTTKLQPLATKWLLALPKDAYKPLQSINSSLMPLVEVLA